MFSQYKHSVFGKSFYKQNTITVAKELLGKIIIKNDSGRILKGMITETEAYLGDNDPACHAYRKLTERNKPMFKDGGIAYVYFIYGNYFCFNVVTERKGVGAAVLIRSVEPVEGIHYMRKNRGYPEKETELTNGPAKFCMAFNITGKENELDLKDSNIIILRKKQKKTITVAVSKRIGIKEGADLPYRFFIKGNSYVTKHKFNKEIIKEIIL